MNAMYQWWMIMNDNKYHRAFVNYLDYDTCCWRIAENVPLDKLCIVPPMFLN